MSNQLQTMEVFQKDYHCHTRFARKKARLIWKISDFTTECPSENCEKLTSPTFRIPGDDIIWYLELYPNGDKDHEGFVSLFLYSNTQEEIFITREFFLIDASGSEVINCKYSCKSDFYEGRGPVQFLSRVELLNHKDELLPNDELTVGCVVSKKAEPVSRSVAILQPVPLLDDHQMSTLDEDWAKCYDVDNSTDVVLKVGDAQISAHKLVLTCRSPVFASMFSHNMLERNTNEVVITDVEFDVLKELVRFMYTDMITLNDVDFVVKLLIAADKYAVPSLKARCAGYLATNVSESCVFQVLEVAHACNEEGLLQRCMNIIQREMSSVTSIIEWLSDLNVRPNVLSLILNLLKGKKPPEDGSS